MTDKRKNEILAETNRKLSEEIDQLKQENKKLKAKLDGDIHKQTGKFKREQKKIIDELVSLKKKYQKELTELRKSRKEYEKTVSGFMKTLH